MVLGKKLTILHIAFYYTYLYTFFQMPFSPRFIYSNNYYLFKTYTLIARTRFESDYYKML